MPRLSSAPEKPAWVRRAILSSSIEAASAANVGADIALSLIIRAKRGAERGFRSWRYQERRAGRAAGKSGYQKYPRPFEEDTLAIAPLELEGHSEAVYSLAFSPDMSVLASGDYGGTIHLWDRVTGAAIGTFVGRNLRREKHQMIASLAFSPDGILLAAGISDHTDTLRLWDITNRAERVIVPGPEITSLAYSPDGSLVACGADEVLLRDGHTGAQHSVFAGHHDYVLSVAFSPDGSLLASGTAYDEGIVRIWDVATGSVLMQLGDHPGNAERVSFSRDGTRLFSLSWGALHLWDIATGRELARWTEYGGHAARMALNRDGTLVALERQEGERWASSRRLADGTHELKRGPGYRSTVRIVEVRTERELAALHGHFDDLTCMTFGDDGRTLATADGDGRIFLWDLAQCL